MDNNPAYFEKGVDEGTSHCTQMCRTKVHPGMHLEQPARLTYFKVISMPDERAANIVSVQALSAVAQLDMHIMCRTICKKYQSEARRCANVNRTQLQLLQIENLGPEMSRTHGPLLNFNLQHPCRMGPSSPAGALSTAKKHWYR